jgi:cell wall-associated NlpC family hydrolase
VSGLTAVLSCSGVAGADQIADKRAQAAQIAARLSSDDYRINQLSEQYDGARLRQQQVEAQLTAARAGLARTDGQVQSLGTQLRDLAVAAYLRSGRPVAVQLVDRNAVALATVGRAYEELAAGNERELLDTVHALRATLAVQRSALESASRDAVAASTRVGQLRQAAEAAVAEEQALLSQVQGDLATLVAQAQAASEARLAAQVQADLAARAAQQTASRARTGSAPAGSLLAAPGGGRAPGPPPPPPGPPPPVSSRAGVAVATAQAQLGKPYQFGAAGPGSFDCSGLTMYAWAAAGVALAHFTGAQYAASTHIALSQLQPGDLVFFYGDLSHVGIYVGGGTMIHAPHTGDVVRYASIYQMGTTEIFAGRVG